MSEDITKDGILISQEFTHEQMVRNNVPVRDLLRNSAGELILIDPYKSREFIHENPSFSIVGVGLSAGDTKTPFGDIGAVIE